MKPLFIAATCSALLVMAPAASGQSPQPGQQSPGMTSTPQPLSPNPIANEAAAQKQLEGNGYGDIRGLGANNDGSHSARATINGRQVEVTVDSHGNVRER
jgi:hypothetical protein